MPELTKEEKAYLAQNTRQNKKDIAALQETIADLKAIIQKGQDTPAFIDQINGRRVPYIGGADIVISAASAARVEGRFQVTADGPFVIQGIHLIYTRTDGPYKDKPVPATTVGNKMAQAAMQLGDLLIYDNPVGFDCDVEISDTQTDRGWQNIAFPSALCSPENNNMYYFPVAYLAAATTTLQIFITPTRQQTYAGLLRVSLLGYKIVQGAAYQP